METLFSTVAQISFTLVGLFVVALTVDSDSRIFWFGEKPQSRYAYLNLLIMLIPGLFALGGLVSLGEGIFPSWPIAAMFLLIIVILAYRQLKMLKKSPDYKLISDYETNLDSLNVLKGHIWYLLFLSVVGSLAYSSPAGKPLQGYMDILAKIFLYFALVTSVFPVNIFLRVYTENKKRNLKQLETDQIYTNSSAQPSGYVSFVLLIAVLVSFVTGILFSNWREK